MDARIIAAIVACLLLAGCSTTRTGSLCSVGPFIADAGATQRWTPDEKRQLVALNRSGEAICGWKAP